MEKNELISIVVPTRNRYQMLREALTSLYIAKRINFDLDVIVVDDGPTTEAECVASSFPVTYVTAGGRGAADARNIGIQHARGDLLTFLDDDDVITADGLVHLVTVLRSHPEYAAVLGRFKLTDANLQPGEESLPTKPIHSGQIFDQLLRHIPPLGTILIRTAIARNIGPLNNKLQGGEDWDWALRIARRYPIGFVDAVVMHARAHTQIRDYTATTEEGVAARRFRDTMAVFKSHTSALPCRRWLFAQRAGFAWRGLFASDFVAMSWRYAANRNRQAAVQCMLLALHASPVHTTLVNSRRLRRGVASLI